VASALLRMGRISGVARPAVATPIPVPGGLPTVLLDAGAMAECQPPWLVQFAQMGSVYSTVRYGIDRPRVGLLSIGEEPTKGTPFVKETHELLTAASGIEFMGNVEGRDIMTSAVDVVVTDGFTGNVVLKTLEGALRAMVTAIGDVLVSPEAGDAGAHVLGLLAPLAADMDPDTTGGAMLLGVDGVCIISHGSSSALAIVNAVSVAHDMVERGLVAALATAVAAR
jgi:glycerol-3-phosphate acyltransferase PlsX